MSHLRTERDHLTRPHFATESECVLSQMADPRRFGGPVSAGPSHPGDGPSPWSAVDFGSSDLHGGCWGLGVRSVATEACWLLELSTLTVKAHRDIPPVDCAPPLFGAVLLGFGMCGCSATLCRGFSKGSIYGNWMVWWSVGVLNGSFVCLEVWCSYCFIRLQLVCLMIFYGCVLNFNDCINNRFIFA